MYLLEVVAQNVRGFSPRARVSLRPGLLVLKPVEGERGLALLLSALLFPDGKGGDGTLAKGADAKASATILGNDQLTYRVSRELGKSGMLQKLNTAEKRFETLTQEPRDIVQGIRSAGLPTQ